MVDEKPRKVEYFRTGLDLMDCIVGGGSGMGYPMGKIVNYVGDKSSSKTFQAVDVIACAYYDYGKRFKWKFDDCESGFSFNTTKLYGFEIMPEDPKERTKSSTVEELYGNVRQFAESLKGDQVGIYVVDSLDGLTSDESDNLADERFKAHKEGKDFNQGSYKMGKAKYLSQEFFPQLAELLEDKKVLLIILSQVRQNIDPMSFEKFARAGGKALDFYCHTVVWLANINKVKRKERVVGVTIKAKTTKSKTPRPYREGFLSIIFDYGLDNSGTSIDFLFDLRGDSGVLLKEANEIVWDNAKPKTLTSVRDFLIEVNLMEAYKSEGYKVKLSDMLEYIKAEAPQAVKDKFTKDFGTTYTRDELIQYIESNNLQGELKKRTIAKWEAIEDSIKTVRGPKYGR